LSLDCEPARRHVVRHMRLRGANAILSQCSRSATSSLQKRLHS
jgi:hypothetical protein